MAEKVKKKKKKEFQISLKEGELIPKYSKPRVGKGFCKGSSSKYFQLVGHTILVATTPFCHLGHKISHEQ